MIWLGGWRRCDCRRRRDTVAPDQEMQRAVLAVALRVHPDQLSLHDLGDELLGDPVDLLDAMAVATAVRDLVAAGLLQSNGVSVSPTSAALHFERLVMCR